MIKIDIEKNLVIAEENGKECFYPMASPEAFSIISEAWLRCGWDNKYVYSFTWMGRPIIQLPDDVMRIQEIIYKVKPDVIIETGIAHGGSLIFHASLCKAMGKGRVIGVDIEIRPHNRKAIESHELFGYISLIEGNSVDGETVDKVKELIKAGERGLVILDSNHSKGHVLVELNAYSQFVAIDSYVVAEDGIMGSLVGAPRSAEDWYWNNPKAAVEEFVSNNNNFIIEDPSYLFNEGSITRRVTYWPSAFVRRIK